LRPEHWPFILSASLQVAAAEYKTFPAVDPLIRYAFIPLLFVWFVTDARAETLPQAVARAVTYFPDVQAALSRQSAAAAQTGQARADLYPSVNLALGEGRERSRNSSTRFQGEDPTLTRREADLSATQLVFDGGASTGQVRRFGARAEGARFSVNDTADNTGARAGQVFLDVRRLREQLGVARDNVSIHDRTLSDVTLLADAGRGRRADVTQADARRALAVSAFEQLAGQLEQSESAYRYFTGRFPTDLDPPPDLASKLPMTINDAVREALAASPSIRSAEKEFEAAQFDMESVRARYAMPRITLEAGGSRNRDLDGIPGANNDVSAMLRLRYNLFRGFGDVERVRESQARIDEALAGLNRARNEVEREVRQGWNALIADRLRLPQLAEYARASADVAEVYRLQFQLGQRSLLDVLNAENERFNAVSGFLAGQAAVVAGEIRVLAGMGRFLQAMGVNPPQPGAPGAAAAAVASAAPGASAFSDAKSSNGAGADAPSGATLPTGAAPTEAIQ
jgi:adhesin transport system outer membrane protein